MDNRIEKKYSARRKLLVYKKFQLTLIGINIAIMGMAFGFMGIQMSRCFKLLRELGVSVDLPASHGYFRFIDFQLKTFLTSGLVAFLAASIVSLGVTLWLSHRLAGPIVRLKQYFSSVSDAAKKGESFPSVRFRENDFFTDLPPLINEALDHIQKSERDEAA